MDFFQKSISHDVSSPLSFPLENPHAPEPTSSVQDSITSLMNMADKMEALLPPDLMLDLNPATSPPSASASVSASGSASGSMSGPAIVLPATGAAATAPMPIKVEQATKPEPVVFHDCLSSVTGASVRPETSACGMAANEDVLDVTPISLDSDFLRDVTDVSGPLSVASAPTTHDRTFGTLTKGTASENTSPCAVREFPAATPPHATGALQRVQKTRKTTRKPKTYSKPVASRFCHICSRMPRRGQGSATCRRMAEGFCRKIVCEQCLRDQGWNYEDIASNPGNWLCPHCAEICPPRSQCHIYNRINARRKRAPQKQSASVAAALASSDVLLGRYGHLFNGGQTPTAQILQPPPNFRLNLPPHYSQQ